MKEWARPARPTAFTVPILSKYAVFSLQSACPCRVCIFREILMMIAADLTTGDATSIGTWARCARRRRARRRTTWTRRSLLRAGCRCVFFTLVFSTPQRRCATTRRRCSGADRIPWDVAVPTSASCPFPCPYPLWSHTSACTAPHHIPPPRPEPPPRPVSHPIIPVPLRCLPPHVPPLLRIVSSDTISHLPRFTSRPIRRPLPPSSLSLIRPSFSSNRPPLLPASLSLPPHCVRVSHPLLFPSVSPLRPPPPRCVVFPASHVLASFFPCRFPLSLKPNPPCLM
ncbi:hypothetical protein C8R44DRAFT_982039, partial [Mycena epipterygia]